MNEVFSSFVCLFAFIFFKQLVSSFYFEVFLLFRFFIVGVVGVSEWSVVHSSALHGGSDFVAVVLEDLMSIN